MRLRLSPDRRAIHPQAVETELSALSLSVDTAASNASPLFLPCGVCGGFSLVILETPWGTDGRCARHALPLAEFFAEEHERRMARREAS